jgi:hypothetical protein
VAVPIGLGLLLSRIGYRTAAFFWALPIAAAPAVLIHAFTCDSTDKGDVEARVVILAETVFAA